MKDYFKIIRNKINKTQLEEEIVTIPNTSSQEMSEIKSHISYNVYIKKLLPILETLREITIQTKTEGCFFLGSGSIKENMAYYFYSKTKNGGKEFGWIRTSGATIFEVDSITPRIETYYKRCTSEKLKNWLPITALNNKVVKRYIYVPKNSIVNEYKLNLE